MSMQFACPSCHAPAEPDDYLCTSCGLLLRSEEAMELHEAEPTIVQALLSPRVALRMGKVSAPPQAPQALHLLATRPYFTPLRGTDVPRLRVGLGAGLPALHAFEAYVASFIDGEQTLSEMAQAAELSEMEATVVLRRLQELNVVEIHRQGAVPPRKTPQAPPPKPEATPPLLAIEPSTLVEVGEPTEVSRSPASPSATRPARSPGFWQRILPRITPTPAAPPPRQPAARPAAPPGAAPTAPARPASPRQPPPPVAPEPSADRASEFLEKAIRLERSGQHEAAVDVLAEAIGQVRQPAPLYNKLALILLHQRRDHVAAARLLQLALEYAPDNLVYAQNLQQVRLLSESHPPSAPKRPRPWSLHARKR